MATRRTSRGRARREAILTATQRIIAAGGPRTVSHRDVATEAGVPLAATTYYFASKERLIFETFVFAAENAVANMRQEMPRLLSGRSPEGLASALAAYYAEQLDRDRSGLMTLYELYMESGRNPALRPAVEDWNQASAEIARLIVEAAGSRSIEADAHLLIMVTDGLLLEQLNTPTPPYAEAMRETFLRVLRAVSPPHRAAQDG